MSEKRPKFMTETEAIIKESIAIVDALSIGNHSTWCRVFKRTVRTMTQLAIAEKERK